MPINPLVFANQVADEFRRYLLSAFPMTDPDLAQQACSFLEGPTPLDMPLVKGPYVTLSETFATGDPVQELADKGLLHHVMPGIIGYPRMYRHQQEVLEAVKAGKHVLISTGTGSGKTEAFLYPIVDELLRERDQGIVSGLKAILIYPMNALANDQLDRLREMLGGTEITFAQWIGTTPRTGKSALVDRSEATSREAYLSERTRRLEEARKKDRAARPLAPPEECLSEKEIREQKPRILITNYRQLEILTTRLPDVALFAEAPLRYLVFDEAHTYDGAAGAEVACLTRRIRALAGKTADEVICIGTSATLTDPERSDDDAAAIRFAARFFGVDENKVKLVGESYVQRKWPNERYEPAPPPGDGMERLNSLLTALGEPEDKRTIKDIVQELTNQLFEPDVDWRASLFDLLLKNDYVYRCATMLKRPKELAEGAWQISNQVKQNRLPQGEQASAELLTYLALGAAARKGGESLLKPKVHFFIRGLDEMVVALDGDSDETKLTLFPSIADAKDKLPLRRDNAFFPVLVCRSCGQHFFERHYHNLDIAATTSRKLSLEGGNAQGDVFDSGNAYWSPAPNEDGQRIVLTNRLLEEIEQEGEGSRASKHTAAFLCRQCGALHLNPGSKCLADGCGHKDLLLRILAIGDPLSSCPSCGSLSNRIGGRIIEPARTVRAVTVADVHILAQGMVNAAPKEHQKLVIFTDSRQDAAFQAGWMQDHGRRIRLRHLMHEIIQESDQPLSLDYITDSLQARFQKDKKLVDILLPELVEENADIIFGQRNLWVRVGKALEYMVIREFSAGLRRREVLEAMGLARVEYIGLRSDHPKVLAWADLLGISSEEAIDAIALILDIWRRSRLLYIPRDPIYSKYHPKDDAYLLAGLLPVHDFKPEGLILQPRPKERNKRWRSLTNIRNNTTIQLLLKAWTNDPNPLRLSAAVGGLWYLLTEELGLLEEVEIRDQRGRQLDVLWQVNADELRIVRHNERHRCKKCQRVMTRPAPKNICSRRYCSGETVREDPDFGDYNVAILRQPFTMVNSEEHTAQVPGDVRDKIEQDFKSRFGRTNCLVATPTLELGVDIGALDMVLLRNVPPRAANYWQRAGRAGRQERMAVITTYCRRSNHDRHFFEDPLRLLEGSIAAPTFNLLNPLMVEKHVRSALLSLLLLRSKEKDDEAINIRSVMEILLPPFIRDYLLDKENLFREQPPSTAPLHALLGERKVELADKLVELFSQYWPGEAAHLVNHEQLDVIISGAADELAKVIDRLYQRLLWARATRQKLHERKDHGLIEREDEQLLRRCDDFIQNIVRSRQSTYTLTVLGTEGFLPGYGVYEGGVTALARSGFTRYAGPITFELSRAKAVALREFVPGNRLYANRGTFYVSRYHLRADTEGKVQTLVVDPEKGYIAPLGASAGYGQSELDTVEAMPIADLDIAHAGRITEDENLRFAMPTLIVGQLKKRNRGGIAYKIGEYEVHHLRGQGMELVNLGEAGKARKHELGYLICPVCGAAKSPYVVDLEKSRFLSHHNDRCGREPIPFALSAHVDVDMLRFHKLNSIADGVNIGESLRTSAARILDMGQDDLQLLQIAGADKTLDFLIYDPMPGGSGLLEQILVRWNEIIEAAFEVLNCGSKCEKACYTCLKTYRNQYYHEHLDRFHAAKLMEMLRYRPDPYRKIDPVFEESGTEEGTPSNKPEAQLRQILAEHQFPPGKLRARVNLPDLNMSTIPDWLYEDPGNPMIKVAIYMDGMSRALHGDPKRTQKDAILRQALELHGYKVIIIQSRDLADPEMMRHHLKKIAEAIGKQDY